MRRAEQAELVKYVGWGGIPQIFDKRKSASKLTKGLAPERECLKKLLIDAEWAAARKSIQNAHYTSREIIGRKRAVMGISGIGQPCLICDEKEHALP